MYTKRVDFGGDEECDISYEKCKRLEVLARRVEKEKRRKEKPIIKEKDMFENWKVIKTKKKGQKS